VILPTLFEEKAAFHIEDIHTAFILQYVHQEASLLQLPLIQFGQKRLRFQNSSLFWFWSGGTFISLCVLATRIWWGLGVAY